VSADPDVVLGGFADETVELGGGEVHLLRGGSGPPLLYLHGGGAAGLWRRFHALLAERFEVFAPDHPGFGGSSERPDLVDVAGLASHYLDLIDHFDRERALLVGAPFGGRGTRERALLVGASFGGRVACELALLVPERFSRLVLLAPVGLDLPEHPVTPLFPRPREEARGMLFCNQEMARRFSSGSEFGCVLGTERDHRALGRFLPTEDIAPRLGSIELPTLLIWGDDDRVVPPAHGECFAELMPDARLFVVRECGHGLPFEAPEAVARAIADFEQQGGVVP
jgi:pimeloyl-ACP methyl ester carboxylesterase